MRLSKAFLVFRKDWKEIRRNWQIMLPIIILPAIFSVLLPIIVSIPSGSDTTGLGDLTAGLPPDVQQQLASLPPDKALLYVTTVFLFAPFFLIIPLMVSSVISADSFAGEKERKTIEALLITPLSDSELFFGKVLVAFVPSMLVTILSFAVYSAIVDYLAGMLFLPNAVWLVMIFLLAPAIALAGIGLSVMVSAKVKGFREAQQISAMLVLPVLVLFFAQINGALVLGPLMLLAIAGLVGLFDIVIMWLSIRGFEREKILQKM